MNEIIFAGREGLTHKQKREAHDSWELIYCLKGGGEFAYSSGEISYGQGNVAIIPAGLPHAHFPKEGGEFIHAHMAMPAVATAEPFVFQDDSRRFLLDAFRAALYYFQISPPEAEMMLAAYGNLLWCHIAAKRQIRRCSPVVEEIERDILSHLEDSAYELDSFLRGLPFNYDYLRKLFQKEMAVTPHQYLNSKRLQMAANALIASGSANVSVADISRLCGFREPLYFSRMFKKKFGMAPSFYAQTRLAGEAAPEEGEEDFTPGV